MNKKIIVFSVLVILLAYFVTQGLNEDEKTETTKREITSIDKSSKVKNVKDEPMVSNEKSNFIGGSRKMSPNSFYAQNAYFNTLMSDQAAENLFIKTADIFKDSQNAEDLAAWVGIGWIFDSSPEYGMILQHSLKKINENPELNFSLIEQKIKTLNPEDSFIRGQLLNLVNQIDVKKEQKIKFFGSELSRPAVVDSEGRFTPDSLNITTALIMLKNNGAQREDLTHFFNDSLKVNNNTVARNKLIARFKTYFPDEYTD